MPSRGEKRRLRTKLTRNNYGARGRQATAMTISMTDILRESKNLVIKPGMRLVWDDELNRMVWR